MISHGFSVFSKRLLHQIFTNHIDFVSICVQHKKEQEEIMWGLWEKSHYRASPTLLSVMETFHKLKQISSQCENLSNIHSLFCQCRIRYLQAHSPSSWIASFHFFGTSAGLSWLIAWYLMTFYPCSLCRLDGRHKREISSEAIRPLPRHPPDDVAWIIHERKKLRFNASNVFSA